MIVSSGSRLTVGFAHNLLPPPPKSLIITASCSWSHEKKNQQQQQLFLSAHPHRCSIHRQRDTDDTFVNAYISPPPIDLEDNLFEEGEDNAPAPPPSSEEALDAFYNGVAVIDLSNFGRIRVSGDDRVQFLQNQSTADFSCLNEGQGLDTVFITPTARTIDIAHAWVMKNAITLMVSPETRESLTAMLSKYIFFADKVEINDFTEETRFFVLVGPKSSQIMNSLNLGDLVGKPYGTHFHYNVNGLPITVGVGSIISEEGFSMLMSTAAAESVWNTFLAQGAILMAPDAWERLRIYEGRPAPGKELTQDFNVLEAGLWNSISLTKGCYKGQETVARLITYDGVKQKLWGLRLSAPADPGSPITVDGKKVGILTSYAPRNNGQEHVGLGYIKVKAATEGHTLTVGNGIVGEVVNVPFLTRQRPPPARA